MSMSMIGSSPAENGLSNSASNRTIAWWPFRPQTIAPPSTATAVPAASSRAAGGNFSGPMKVDSTPSLPTRKLPSAKPTAADLPPGWTRIAVAPARPIASADSDCTVRPSANETSRTSPATRPAESVATIQATAPDSSVPRQATPHFSRAGMATVASRSAEAERNRGSATARRNSPTRSTATIVPTPPSVMTIRAMVSPARTQGAVRRRRARPVKVAGSGMELAAEGIPWRVDTGQVHGVSIPAAASDRRATAGVTGR